MLEPIPQLLALMGTPLNFDNFTVKGILGFSLTVFHGETSQNTVEVREYKVRLSAKDVADNEIVKDMTFCCTDAAKTYNFLFKIKGNPIVDMTGWATLYVNYIESIPL